MLHLRIFHIRRLFKMTPSFAKFRLQQHRSLTLHARRPLSTFTCASKVYNNSSTVSKSPRHLSSSATPEQSSPISCWKCNNSISNADPSSFPLKCPKCESLQKVIGSNYFQILGLPPLTYKIDDDTLTSNMKELQKQLHPDLYGSKSHAEQEISQYLSSIVNQGVKILQNPISRGLYLLQLHGLDIDMERLKTLDHEFLMEVMELNEKLESLDSPESWLKFRKRNQTKMESLEKKLEDAFESENLNRAQLILSKMKYYENLQDKLKEVQSKFGVVD